MACARPISSCLPGLRAARSGRRRTIPRRSVPPCWRTRSMRRISTALVPREFRAEWKWDGVRVQAVTGRGADGKRVTRLYSRTGEEVSAAFPDMVGALRALNSIT